MRVGLAYDLKEAISLGQAEPEDTLEEYDSPKTVELIISALESAGHAVTKLGGGREFLNNILHEKVDIVFNIAEGRGNYRSREAQVPAILEMLDIPYTGSDPQCLAICLDKPLTKKLVAMTGVSTPKYRVIAKIQELWATSWDDFSFPVIIKPAYEGSSKGIRLGSLAASPSEITEMVGKLWEDYRQPMIVEEFIAGDEVTVGIIGNSPPKVIGMMRILPKSRVDYFVYSLEVKREWQSLVDYECPAQLRGKTQEEVVASSLKAFKALGCRDFARLDFRVSPDGMPSFLEINPLAGLGDYSDLVIMAIKMGWSYESLIKAILDTAVERYPLCVHE